MALKRNKRHIEWDTKKAEIQEQIAELGFSEEYEPDLIYAALLEYLYRELNKNFRTTFGEEHEDESS